MLRYRRYRAFVIFTLIAIFAIYHFGSESPQVDYLKQQLSFHGGKYESTLSSGDNAAQDVLKSELPPPIKPKWKPDPVRDGPVAAVETKYAPPPVKEPERPVQHAPPGSKTSESKGEGDAKSKGPVKKPAKEVEHDESELKGKGKGKGQGKAPVKKPAKGSKDETEDEGSAPSKNTDEGRIRVMPNPIPADSFEKIHPFEHGEGRGDYDQLPLDAQPVFWEKPKEHFPLKDASVIPLPTGQAKALPKIQAEFEKETAEQKNDRLAKQDVIKEAFLHAWNGYKDSAWGHDEIKPVSGEYRNPFNGWGATLVDSLDIIWMMGLEDEFEEAVRQVGKIDFKTSRRPDIPLFETTIRYLGGLLGAYDVSGGKYRILLDKAAELAEILIGAFDTPNRMPDTFYQWKPDFASQTHRASGRVVLAELGSLALEFTRLAQLTKEPRYYDAIARITNALEEWQSKTRLPGMWPSHLDASGCEKAYIGGPSSQEIVSQGTVEVLDPKGNPLSKPGATSKDGGMTSKDAVTSNRDEDELEGVDVKHPLKPGKTKSGKPAGEMDLTTDNDLEGTDIKKGRIPGWDVLHDEGVASKLPPPKKQTSDEKDLQGTDIKKGRIPGWDEGHKEDATTPKLPPPKKKGSDENEFVPLDLPDPIVFKVKGGKKETRQLHDLDAKVAAEKGTKDGLFSYDNSHMIPPQLPSHKHDDDLPSTSTPIDYSKEECIPQGLASQTKWGTDDFTLGSLADSTYEYLPKMYLMLNGLTDQYRTMYEAAIDVAKEHLLFRQMIPDSKREILVSGQYSITQNIALDGASPTMTRRLKTSGSHLTCFVGGMFAMGSKLFDRKDDLEIAKKLTDGCVYAYEMTATGIMPESFNAVACDDRKSCPWNETKWWEALDPDLGEWRMKNYEASVKFYETQVALKEITAKEAKKHKSVPETLGDAEDDDGEVVGTKKQKPAASLEDEDDEIAAAIKKQKSTIFVGDGEGEDEDKDENTDSDADADLKKTRSNFDLTKRQLKVTDDVDDDEMANPLKPIVVGADHGSEYWEQVALAQDKYEAEQAAKQIEIAKGTYDWDESEWQDPTLTTDYLPPLYSPIKPPGHEEFVKKMIEEDRLPPGVQSMGDRRYILRPEALESVFYMHRITGSPYWRRAGWKMISSILKHTRTSLAHSAIDDVTKTSPQATDSMESFWLAETLKYAWLLFEEEGKWSLDEWVFNTEAHPFKKTGVAVKEEGKGGGEG